MTYAIPSFSGNRPLEKNEFFDKNIFRTNIDADINVKTQPGRKMSPLELILSL